MTYFRTY